MVEVYLLSRLAACKRLPVFEGDDIQINVAKDPESHSLWYMKHLRNMSGPCRLSSWRCPVEPPLAAPLIAREQIRGRSARPQIPPFPLAQWYCDHTSTLMDVSEYNPFEDREAPRLHHSSTIYQGHRDGAAPKNDQLYGSLYYAQHSGDPRLETTRLSLPSEEEISDSTKWEKSENSKSPWARACRLWALLLSLLPWGLIMKLKSRFEGRA